MLHPGSAKDAGNGGNSRTRREHVVDDYTTFGKLFKVISQRKRTANIPTPFALIQIDLGDRTTRPTDAHHQRQPEGLRQRNGQSFGLVKSAFLHSFRMERDRNNRAGPQIFGNESRQVVRQWFCEGPAAVVFQALDGSFQYRLNITTQTDQAIDTRNRMTKIDWRNSSETSCTDPTPVTAALNACRGEQEVKDRIDEG